MLLTICEDTPAIAQKLERRIHEEFPSIHIQQFSTGEALLKAKEAHIYLLDICLPDINGIDLAKEIRLHQPHAPIIFITAYEAYVFDAFDVAPLHYLVKPINEQKLCTVLRKAILQCQTEQVKRTFTIQTGAETIVLKEEDLYFAEAQGRKITLYLVDQTITYYDRISRLEQQLNGPFFRTHRSYLVHFKHIKRYDQTTITFTNHAQAYIARNRYKSFLAAFTTFLQETNQ